MKNEPTFESIAAPVWEEPKQEATAGFPLLSAIPATGVVRFLDYFESCNEAGRERLLHDLAPLAAFAIQRRGERPQAWRSIGCHGAGCARALHRRLALRSRPVRPGRRTA